MENWIDTLRARLRANAPGLTEAQLEAELQAAVEDTQAGKPLGFSENEKAKKSAPAAPIDDGEEETPDTESGGADTTRKGRAPGAPVAPRTSVAGKGW